MIRYIVKYSFLLFLYIFINGMTAIQANADCDPVVDSMPDKNTASQALSTLAERYNFSLTFPKSLDRRVDVEDEMKLSQLIKFLTLDMNTVLRHEKVAGCVEPKLIELIVMSVGEDTEYVIVESKPVLLPHKDIQPTLNSSPAEPFNIEDMEQYVTEVLMRERRSNIKNMTVEQKMEFREMREILKVELSDEISEIKKNRKQKRKKEKI